MNSEKERRYFYSHPRRILSYEEAHKTGCKYCNPESLSDDILCLAQKRDDRYEKLTDMVCGYCKSKEPGVFLYKKYSGKSLLGNDFPIVGENWIHFDQNGIPICEYIREEKEGGKQI